jgi:hypothetical protein
MAKRLAEMAYLRDESGCYVEPNAEVRAAAVKALMACCPGTSPVIEIPNTQPRQDDYIPETGTDGGYVPEAGQGENTEGSEEDTSKRKNENGESAVEDLLGAGSPASSSTSWDGMLLHANQDLGIGHVHLADKGMAIPVGTDLYAYGLVDGQRLMVGTLRVYQSFPGSANVRAVNDVSRQAIVKGVAVLRQADVRIAIAPNLTVPQMNEWPRERATIPAVPVASTTHLDRDPRYMSDSMNALVKVLRDTLDQ